MYAAMWHEKLIMTICGMDGQTDRQTDRQSDLNLLGCVGFT